MREKKYKFYYFDSTTSKKYFVYTSFVIASSIDEAIENYLTSNELKIINGDKYIVTEDERLAYLVEIEPPRRHSYRILS